MWKCPRQPSGLAVNGSIDYPHKILLRFLLVVETMVHPTSYLISGSLTDLIPVMHACTFNPGDCSVLLQIWMASNYVFNDFVKIRWIFNAQLDGRISLTILVSSEVQTNLHYQILSVIRSHQLFLCNSLLEIKSSVNYFLVILVNSIIVIV